MYRTITLPNGARILTEYIPGARTAALGFFIGTGSRHERAAENGAAHFIEHMLFKGTARRDAGQLAREMDAIGGQINAYTTKEMTCYYARCLDSHLPRCLDMMCDMLFNSRFAEQDVELERGVILEEIGMYEDTPEDLVSERLSAAVYKGAALGRPILGRASTLEKMNGAWLREYQRTHYVPGNVVVSLAGNYTPLAVEELKLRLSVLKPAPAVREKSTAYHPAVTVRRKAIEQNHVILAFPAMGYRDPRRYELMMLNTILGGGVSSRLFQQLREQAKANVLMGMESVQARMSHMGTSALMYGQVRETDQILAEYDRITREQLRELAGELFQFSRASLSAVGRTEHSEEYSRILPLHV